MAVTDATKAARIDLSINQGATFNKVFRWGMDLFNQVPITAISNAAPPVITAAGHGIPEGWSVWVGDVVGMDEINRPYGPDLSPANAPYDKVHVVSNSQISLPGQSSIAYGAYTSGGAIQYFQPVDLTAYTARMMIREDIGDVAPLVTLTTENGGIAVDRVNNTITVTITNTATDALDFEAAVYDLELVAGDGTVTRIAQGKVSLSKQVTRS